MSAHAEKIPVHYPAERCSADGCGDKIKDGEMWRDDEGHFFHIECCDDNGAPLPFDR